MSEIAMIGDRDSIMGFKALGVAIYPVETVQQAMRAISEAVQQQYRIVFITEQVMPDRSEVEMLLGSRPYPVITPIPSNRGSLGLGMRRLRDLIIRAAGADILGEEE
ncbi:V-type ATP synthase subunit F [Candidatus Poribacteria bacterium]|nr:V-type ATP synthase subunit F [Candidatus Poribacteria bacterium]HDO76598.1 V-type ATP synthase subunit F [Candidatus Poribacteria bacterium]HEX30203.1 V-type ATP synthase subunit F [Candidatus Poribacteria bacterium]